jgi:hypothetical protein
VPFLLSHIGDLHRDERRCSRRQFLPPSTQKAWSDAIAARYLRRARVDPRCFFENPLLVCVVEPAPMPLTRRGTMGPASGEEG